MDRPFTHRAAIPPVEGGAIRPLWSVMIPTHNNGEYLRAALQSVLAQDPGADLMQIEVVDDATSTGDPEALVRELGGGRVDYFRHPERVGHTRNFEACLRRARGKLVHLLHGDDLVKDGFYRRLQTGFKTRPDVGAAFCRFIAIDEHDNYLVTAPREMDAPGVMENWLSRIATGQRLQTPCMVVRREVYERLGGFDERLRGAEDWEMWVRIAAHYPVWYEPDPLAVYRIHLASKSQQALRTGANVIELRKAIHINHDHLPPADADRITRIALRTCATTALRRASRLGRAGDAEGARAQRRAAWETSRSPAVIAAALGWLVRDLVHGTRRAARLVARRFTPG